MANVASVPVEHQHGTIGKPTTPGPTDIKSRQLLAIVSRYYELLEVAEAELRRSWHFRPGIRWDMGRIDQSPR